MNGTTQNIFNNLEKGFVVAESALNTAGYIPLVSSVSGGIRGTIGALQFQIGLLSALGFGIAAAVSDSEEYSEIAGRSLHYAAHGVGNNLRGTVEVIPVINLLTILYDLSGERYKYAIETEATEPATVTEAPAA